MIHSSIFYFLLSPAQSPKNNVLRLDWRESRLSPRWRKYHLPYRRLSGIAPAPPKLQRGEPTLATRLVARGELRDIFRIYG
jgi:hypothetical protein